MTIILGKISTLFVIYNLTNSVFYYFFKYFRGSTALSFSFKVRCR